MIDHGSANRIDHELWMGRLWIMRVKIGLIVIVRENQIDHHGVDWNQS